MTTTPTDAETLALKLDAEAKSFNSPVCIEAQAAALIRNQEAELNMLWERVKYAENEVYKAAAKWMLLNGRALSAETALKEKIERIGEYAEVMLMFRDFAEDNGHFVYPPGALQAIQKLSEWPPALTLKQSDQGQEQGSSQGNLPSPPLDSETVGVWRCTRCDRDEIDARANGCTRGPCPMVPR